MKLIVGLGNPGKEYENTKHNLGFRVVEEINSKLKDQNSKFTFDKLFQAEITKGKIEAEDVVLVKPQTFMNESGIAVKKIVTRFSLNVKKDLIVVHDDLTIDFGKLKISTGNSSGNHNGVQSVIDHLGTQDFIRVRLGIGRGDGIIHDVVLSKFKPDEQQTADEMVQNAIRACIQVVIDGIEKAMNSFN